MEKNKELIRYIGMIISKSKKCMLKNLYTPEQIAKLIETKEDADVNRGVKMFHKRRKIYKPKTISYLRVSTNGQDVEKNKTEVRAFANKRDLGKVEFITEKISGKVSWKKRKIKQLIDSMQQGDNLISPEISRLGRSAGEIFQILEAAKEKGINVYLVKENRCMDDSLESSIYASAFGLAAEIEHSLLMQRTKEGREMAKKKGVKFGRPPGSKNKQKKLDPHLAEIKTMIEYGAPQTRIAQRFNVSVGTVYNFLKEHGIKY